MTRWAELEEAQLTTQLAVLQFWQSPNMPDRTALLGTLMRLDYLNATVMLMSRQAMHDNGTPYEKAPHFHRYTS